MRYRSRMPLFKIVRFEIGPDAQAEAENAMREFADYVRSELPQSSWISYRDRHVPTRYAAVVIDHDPDAAERHRKAPGTRTFLAALQPLLAGEPEETEYELVTSSDLQRRFRGPPKRKTGRPRPRR